MKGLGGILAIIGVLVIVAGLVNHFAAKFITMTHSSVYIAVVGLVVLVVGIVMTRAKGA